jgi:SAM-dependent methyltransferase
MATGQQATHSVYEDGAFVAAFLAKNGHSADTEISPRIREFAAGLAGPRVIDAGCGPGIHARQMAALGLEVVAIDYSEAMIHAAQAASPHEGITYKHLDMRQIGDTFPAASFDGAWVSASLIHVPEVDVPQVLSGVHSVLAANAIARITLKAGTQGARTVTDDKYGVVVDREFVFWEEANFTRLLREAGFDILGIESEQGGITGTEPTRWLRYVARAAK